MTFKIIEASDTRAVDRLLSGGRRQDRAFVRGVHRIVDRVREGGDRALVRFASRFDRVSGPLEVTGDQMRDAVRSGFDGPGTRSAAEVADDVLDAVREDRFWIITSGEMRELVSSRFHEIDGATPQS